MPTLPRIELDLEEGEDTSSDKEQSAHTSGGGTTCGLSRLTGCCGLDRSKASLRGLSRDGTGDGAVGTTPGSAVTRAGARSGGLHNDLGLGLSSDSFGRRNSDGGRGGRGGFRGGKRGARDENSGGDGLELRSGGSRLRSGERRVGLEAVLDAVSSRTLNQVHRVRAAPGLGLGVMSAVVTIIARV